jgi:hypothetical protein
VQFERRVGRADRLTNQELECGGVVKDVAGVESASELSHPLEATLRVLVTDRPVPFEADLLQETVAEGRLTPVGRFEAEPVRTVHPNPEFTVDDVDRLVLSFSHRIGRT